LDEYEKADLFPQFRGPEYRLIRIGQIHSE
jgi:hypothetical protein